TPAPEAPKANGSHLIIRDGDDYLIIDENGLRLRSKDAEIDIVDGQNPQMRMRVREGDQEIDLDVNLDTITNMAVEMLGQELVGGFDLDEQALERELEAIERELEEQLMREFGRAFGGRMAPPAPPAPVRPAP